MLGNNEPLTKHRDDIVVAMGDYKMADMVVDMVAEMAMNMVANMVVDKVADMQVDMVANMVFSNIGVRNKNWYATESSMVKF